MATLTFAGLCAAPKAQLEAHLRDGKGPTLSSLSGFEFRGFNVLAAHERAVMRLLGNLRFIKCFFPGEGTAPALRGYNLRVKNGGLDAPWSTLPDEARPARLGHYKAYATRNRPGPNPYPDAVFLDYAQPENTLFSGSTIDDYVVQPDWDNGDLLLGKALTRLGPLTTQTFFVLERLQPHAR